MHDAAGRRLPDFLLLGAQKAGSSWLGSRLGQHPDLWVHPDELHFFDKEDRYARGLDWYAQQFDAAPPDALVGEKTPDYLLADWHGGAEGHAPDVHRHLHDALPDAKLIVVLRDPVKRAVSAAKHLAKSGRVSPRIKLDDLLAGRRLELAERHAVVTGGEYARFLAPYIDLYGKDRILVLLFEEDVVADPAAGLARCCRHLGVDETFAFEGLHERGHANQRSLPRLYLDRWVPRLRRSGISRRLDTLFPPHKDAPSPETLEALRAHYAEPDAQLAALLRRDLPWAAKPQRKR
ncbi:MAG: sulfotransferase family protein [Thermoplasmatota archaeon]